MGAGAEHIALGNRGAAAGKIAPSNIRGTQRPQIIGTLGTLVNPGRLQSVAAVGTIIGTLVNPARHQSVASRIPAVGTIVVVAPDDLAHPRGL